MPNYSTLAIVFSGGASIQVKGNAPGNGANITGIQNQLSATQTPGGQFGLSFGTGTGNATKAYMEVRQLAPSANETITISSGLTDMFGNAAANMGFSTVRGVFYQLTRNANGANTSTSMTVGNAANPFSSWLGANTATVILAGNGLPYQNGNSTGINITAGVNDGIRFQNNDAANTATYIVAVAGQ